jgi:hypothetical protein
VNTKSLLLTAGVALAVVVAHERYKTGGVPGIKTSH